MKYYKLSIKEDNKIKVGDESSEGGVNYTVNDIDDSTGTATISGKGDMWDYYKDGYDKSGNLKMFDI